MPRRSSSRLTSSKVPPPRACSSRSSSLIARSRSSSSAGSSTMRSATMLSYRTLPPLTATHRRSDLIRLSRTPSGSAEINFTSCSDPSKSRAISLAGISAGYSASFRSSRRTTWRTHSPDCKPCARRTRKRLKHGASLSSTHDNQRTSALGARHRSRPRRRVRFLHGFKMLQLSEDPEGDRPLRDPDRRRQGHHEAPALRRVPRGLGPLVTRFRRPSSSPSSSS